MYKQAKDSQSKGNISKTPWGSFESRRNVKLQIRGSNSDENNLNYFEHTKLECQFRWECSNVI